MTTAERRRSSVGPTLLILAGTLCLAPTASFIKLSGTDPVTATFLRCGLALVALGPLAGWELATRGRPDRRAVASALCAGLLLGADYLMFNASILLVGAGIATVLVNAQVVMFPVLARVAGGTPVPRRVLVATPVLLLGVALVGGLLGGLLGGTDSSATTGAEHSAGAHLVGVLLGLGSAAGYSGYLYLSRAGTGHVMTPVCLSTSAAAGLAGLVGLAGLGLSGAGLSGRLDLPGLALAQPPAAWGYMAGLALCGQVLPWLFISAGGRRLAPSGTAALLVVQVVFALVAARILVHESPTGWQLAGAALVIAAVVASATPIRLPARARRRQVDDPADGPVDGRVCTYGRNLGA